MVQSGNMEGGMYSKASRMFYSDSSGAGNGVDHVVASVTCRQPNFQTLDGNREL